MDVSLILAQAGWFPGRKVDIARSVSLLDAAGYSISAAARELLHEYSGLIISSSDGSGAIWIDGERAATDIDPEWCNAYEEEAGVRLTPVGGYSHMALMADSRGNLWGGYDADYGCLAGSIGELVRVLLVDPVLVRLDRRLTDYGQN